MIIKEQLCTASDCYKSNKYIEVKGLVLHSVGCPQPDPNVFYNTWNQSGKKACCHAVIGDEGVVIQCLPWTMRGWHVGSDSRGSFNNTHIGVEMTESSTIKYTSGSNWEETSDGVATKEHVLSTYKTAVELFAFLCDKYNLNPLDDGVIVSHSEAHKLGYGSNHGDVEHIWRKFNLDMDMFRQSVSDKLAELRAQDTAQDSDTNTTSELTAITGKSVALPDRCKEVITSHGVSEPYLSYVDMYFDLGAKENIRGDIALAQSIVETGWFTFKGDVKPSQNNFAGLGATGNGVRGNFYSTPEEGILAQIQHLKAYANKEELNMPCVDNRFKYVERGVSPYVEYLGIQENPSHKGWAAGAKYGSKILSVLSQLLSGVSIEQSGTQQSEQSNQSGNKDESKLYNVVLLEGYEPIYRRDLSLDMAISFAENTRPYAVVDDNGSVVYRCDIAQSAEFVPFRVKVNVSSLNIRSTPNGEIVGKITDFGVYTIVAVDGNWGKLKSGKGWIYLAHCTKLD